jgi:hypothetical protein
MSPLERTPSLGEHQLTSKQFLAEPQLIQLADEAAHCQRCPLYRNATQAVFGEGSIDAALLLVGEQPAICRGRYGLARKRCERCSGSLEFRRFNKL